MESGAIYPVENTGSGWSVVHISQKQSHVSPEDGPSRVQLPLNRKAGAFNGTICP